MAQSEPWARRLLREMNPRELLRRQRYRTPTFLRIFLDHVEELRFRDPRAGLKLARVAPKLALLVPEAGGAEGRREHRENLTRAHAVCASAYRVAGNMATSEAEYMLAQKLADSEAVSSIVRADLARGLATLRASQKRFGEALDLIDAARAEYTAARDQRRVAVSQAPGLGFAATALAHIKAANHELRGRRSSLTRHLLQWTEGKVYLRLGRPDRAEKRFTVARRGFVRLEAPSQTALVSLDLAALYRAGERWRDLEDLAADTFGHFRELCADFESIAALSLWVDAVQARRGVKAAIDAARETIEARKTARP